MESFQVVIHEIDGGRYRAEVPALAGCAAEGQTVDEAVANVRTAIAAHLAASQRGAGTIPVRGATAAQSLYDAVGGDATFQRLVDTFYRRIEADPVLRPLFPADLAPGKEGQFLFLTQYFGGPHRYTEQRGRPFLRMRHMPFAIGQRERDAWVGHMLAAIDEIGIPEPHRGTMREYFDRAATFMMNQPG
jgi:hemoglobin